MDAIAQRGPLSHHSGDILKSGAPVICHQVNCMGVMGAGLARQIRTAYPSVYERYREFALSRSPKELMGFSLWTSLDKGGQLPFIVNCFAQEGVYKEGPKTDYDALMGCFVDISNICHESYEDCTIAIPDHIGCGLAGGDWSIVYQMIKDAFANYPGDVQIWRRN